MQEEISTIGYRKLIAWQKADLLAQKVYEITNSFPNSEMYGLTSQMRRAALSVPANIVEGYARNSKNEFRHFLSLSLGSLAELGYFIEFSFKQKFIQVKNYNEVIDLKDECGKLIWRLYQSQCK